MIPGFAANALDVIATTPLTINRPGATVRVSGRASDGPATQTQVTASVQPASGRDLLRLPEGQRTKESRLVLTKGELRLRDYFDLDGETFEVAHVKPWMGDFYDAMVVKVEAN